MLLVVSYRNNLFRRLLRHECTTPLPAKFYYASHGYICKLYYIAYKNYAVWVFHFLLFLRVLPTKSTKQQLWHFAKNI